MSERPPVGISGLAAYVPPYRVCLDEWSRWTGNNPDKIRAVVGRSFRMRGSEQSVYTLAATAVLRLIRNYDIDPSRVTYLGFGTESSTDNAAGAVILKGMVNDALRALGVRTLPRSCEVPEFKHACLGGVYAMKGAVRYLATDGAGNQAIVVSADLAQYARGSSGEQTQGAGAVAMLLEENPRLMAIDLGAAGTIGARISVSRSSASIRPRQATMGISMTSRCSMVRTPPPATWKRLWPPSAPCSRRRMSARLPG